MVRDYIWAALRILLGWVFFWAFLDKLLGLGFSTAPEGAWISGGSPTAGFLSSAVYGPLASVYQLLAGNIIIDVLFMLSLLFIGISLLLGFWTKAGAYTGAVLMLLIWSSRFPPQNNPLIDEHIIYIVILIGISMIKDKFRLENKLK